MGTCPEIRQLPELGVMLKLLLALLKKAAQTLPFKKCHLECLPYDPQLDLHSQPYNKFL